MPCDADDHLELARHHLPHFSERLVAGKPENGPVIVDIALRQTGSRLRSAGFAHAVQNRLGFSDITLSTCQAFYCQAERLSLQGEPDFQDFL